MDQAASYVGQRDRIIGPRRTDHDLDEHRSSDREVHKSIIRIVDNLPTEVESEQAVMMFLDVRKLRHDNWCDFLTTNCLIPGVIIEDTKVSDFVTKTLNMDVLVPKGIASLSPDILMVSENSKMVYIGDVSVSAKPEEARRHKHNKYLPISDFLMQHGVATEMVYFNVNILCTNIYDLCRSLVDLNIIEYNFESIRKYVAFSNSCNTLMETIKSAATDKAKFNRLYAESEKIRHDPPAMPPLPASLRMGQELVYEPYCTENSLMQQIKDETDKRFTSTYFSKDIKDSLDEIDSLIEDNKKVEGMQPKSTLKVVDNSHDMVNKTGYELISNYLDDILSGEEGHVQDLLVHLLPNMNQINKMKLVNTQKMTHADCKNDIEMKRAYVYGKYQYKIFSSASTPLVSRYKQEVTKGKKSPNIKKVPQSINLSRIQDLHDQVSSAINYYGSLSNKPDTLDDSWEAKTRFEHESTKDEREMYSYVKRTNGAQLCNSMSLLYNRISHLSTSLSVRDNIFVPPNGSFIAVMPGHHAPITTKNVDIPFIFITRCRNGDSLTHIEHEYYYTGQDYTYYVSKLCRLNVDKMSNWSNANFKLVSTSCYLLSKAKVLVPLRHKVVGTLTHFILDVHQKTSEYLDLFKYISFMPFADISRLPNLIRDKMNLLMKTRLDAWMLQQLKRFITELGDKEKLNAVKPKLKKFHTDVVPSSLGITMELPSFCCSDVRHTKPEDFIEEINVMNTVRPKHLYGSQFMDKSITQTCEWNDEYEEEVNNFGGWATIGHGEGRFPFDAKFCFSSDAIYYAEKTITDEFSLTETKTSIKLGSSMYSNFMHKNCTLRGCTKDIKDRENASDIHTTSLEACLRKYKEHNFVDQDCTALAFGIRHIESGDTQQYSMSEKDQRGGGRPIATPTIGTKAALMLIEKPECAKGHFMGNNIIVPGKNKLREQCETYKMALSEGSRRNYKMAFQLTEDQTKYSENDNARKFLTYIKCNTTLPQEVKTLQYHVINGLIGREHLIKRMPIGVSESASLSKYIVRQEHSLGVKANIGWPQGMLNFISTNVHCAADLWITKMYNKAYPEATVHTRGLVHSDDSWVVVCCNDIADFERFTIFRMLAKKMFCLKLNEKKLWGSRYLGELVSNYNLNGNVHLSVGKMLANSFGNLSFQNWPVDVNNQISSLQQCYRSGANLGVIITLSTLLKQQMVSTYNVKGKQLENLEVLPIEMGGYPSCSAFELAVTGVSCYYKKLLSVCREKPHSITGNCVSQCLSWSMNKNKISEERLRFDTLQLERKKYYDQLKASGECTELDFKDEDFVDLSIPSRGNVFSAIKHILPKSKKLSKTLEFINGIREMFPSNGLELIVTRPLDLKESLGHLCAQTTSMIYELAADKYSSCSRRMAISQTLQSTGKVVRVLGLMPMTFNQLIDFVMANPNPVTPTWDVVASAFSDDNDIVGITNSIVYHSTNEVGDRDKRKVITKMPFIDDKFKTIGKMTEVLLTVIDLEKKTDKCKDYVVPSVSKETLIKDANNIMRNFKSYFVYYETTTACSLIAQQYYQTLKSRLWTQPHLRSDCLTSFLSDLYGKTIKEDVNYRVYIHIGRSYEKSIDQDLTRTIYFTEVLNTVYPGSFIMESINGMSVGEAINMINDTKLSDNDRVKYAVIQKRFFNNDDYLHAIHKSDHFRSKWLVPQERKGNVYTGAFSALCSLNGQTMEIYGTEGDLKLHSSTTDVILIMKMMHYFVTTHFHHLRYESYSMWGERSFWKSNDTFGTHYLTYNNQVSTSISGIKKTGSIPITINSNLSYGDEISGGVIDTFELDDTLRVIYAHSGGHRSRFDAVKQNFSLPCRDIIQLEPNFLQGIDCEKLYKSGAMECLILNNAHRVSQDTITDLLSTGFVTMNSKVVGELQANLFGKIKNNDYGVNIEDGPLQDEIVEIDLQGMAIAQLEEVNETASPEDITCINIDFIEGVQVRAGALMKVHDIPRVLCMAYTGHISRRRLESMIYHLMSNGTMINWAKKIKDDINEGHVTHEGYCSTISEDQSLEVSLKTYAFIVSSRLNKTGTWLNINADAILSNQVDLETSEYLLSIVNEVVDLTMRMNLIEPRKRETLMDVYN